MPWRPGCPGRLTRGQTCTLASSSCPTHGTQERSFGVCTGASVSPTNEPGTGRQASAMGDTLRIHSQPCLWQDRTPPAVQQGHTAAYNVDHGPVGRVGGHACMQAASTCAHLRCLGRRCASLSLNGSIQTQTAAFTLPRAHRTHAHPAPHTHPIDTGVRHKSSVLVAADTCSYHPP